MRAVQKRKTLALIVDRLEKLLGEMGGQNKVCWSFKPASGQMAARKRERCARAASLPLTQRDYVVRE